MNNTVESELKLWYKQPAKEWVEALPIGNGRLGAMVFGDVFHERIQFNEDTLWTGTPIREKGNNFSYINEARKLIFEEKYIEAQDIINEKIVDFARTNEICILTLMKKAM